MSVVATKAVFKTSDDDEQKEEPLQTLQNGSVNNSEIACISNGTLPQPTEKHKRETGLTLEMPDKSSSFNDESELFTPTSPAAIQVYLDENNEAFATFHLSKKMDKFLQKSRYVSKITYTISLASIVFLAYATFYNQWLVLYYYTISVPLLMLLRLVLYTKLKYQYFMLDLCYFINIAMIIYIWAFPHERELATVLISFNSGPCALATILFRNSLVLHNLDKMTSSYLHVLPMLVCFVARWFPDVLSEHWYTDFVPLENFNTDWDYMGIWLWAVPLAFHILHMLVYLVLIRLVFKPTDDHDYSYRYLSGLSGGGGCPHATVTCCGAVKSEHMQISYCFWTIVYGLLGFVFTPIWYSYYIGHCLFVVFVLLVITWNGARYYMDVFGPKSFK